MTGGTGFIGRELCSRLIRDQHDITILTRQPDRVAKQFGHGVRSLKSLSERTPGDTFDAIINLAGEPIMARRWTAERKRILFESRVTLTSDLVEGMARTTSRPSVFISGSAIGIYGNQGDSLLDEHHSGGQGYAHDLCLAWEQAARGAETLGIRTCLLRTGLVVGRNGGFLQQMLPAFRYGLGGQIGSGSQWMSWIHLQDEIGIIMHLLTDNSAHGAFNATAPNPVTNRDFTRLLARQLHRPALVPLPAWLLKYGMGERAELLLDSQRVIPNRIQALGYEFVHPTLSTTLQDILGVE